MIRFGLCGYGWRAKVYIKLAKDNPHMFEIPLILVKDQKESLLVKEDIKTTTDYNEFRNYEIDFIVNATNKTVNFDLTKKLLALGFYVLQETPFSIYENDIEYGLDNLLNSKLQIAEQYYLYPRYKRMLEIIKSGKIGEVEEVYISTMHDYHAFSLIRKILNCENMNFVLYGKQYKNKVTKTKTRYETFKTGEIIDENSKTAILEFDSKKVIYNFSSEQYRSPIRNRLINIKGTRGEIKDDLVYYLDDQNEPQIDILNIESKDEDLDAIKEVLIKMYDFTLGKGEAYSIKNSIEEAYVSIIMNELPYDEFEKIEVNLND